MLDSNFVKTSVRKELDSASIKAIFRRSLCFEKSLGTVSSLGQVKSGRQRGRAWCGLLQDRGLAWAFSSPGPLKKLTKKWKACDEFTITRITRTHTHRYVIYDDCIHTCMHACMHTYLHTIYKCTYVHTYIDTKIHRYIDT